MLSIVNLVMLALLIFGALALSSSGSVIGHKLDRDEPNTLKKPLNKP